MAVFLRVLSIIVAQSRKCFAEASPNIVQKVRGLFQFVYVCQELAFILVIVALVG